MYLSRSEVCLSFSVYLQLNDRLGLARDLRFVDYISGATNYFFPLFAFFSRSLFSSLYMGIGKISSSFNPLPAFCLYSMAVVSRVALRT